MTQTSCIVPYIYLSTYYIIIDMCSQYSTSRFFFTTRISTMVFKNQIFRAIQFMFLKLSQNNMFYMTKALLGYIENQGKVRKIFFLNLKLFFLMKWNAYFFIEIEKKNVILSLFTLSFYIPRVQRPSTSHFRFQKLCSHML